MQINKIQNDNNANPNFGINLYNTQSLRRAVYVANDMANPLLYSKKNKKILQEFNNSLERIKKSKQADYISISYSKIHDKCVVNEYKVTNGKNDAREAVVLNCKKLNNKGMGQFLHSVEGANAIKALIKYAKTITDVPKQKVKLSEQEIGVYPYRRLFDDFENSFDKIYFYI